MLSIMENALVTIHIKLEDERNNIIDEIEDLVYIHGAENQLFEKLESVLEGKKTGDEFYEVLSPEEAFGKYDESLVHNERLEDLPEDISVGIELDGDDGIVYVVESVTKEYAKLNANHPFAGVSLLASGKILGVEYLSDEAVEEILKAEHQH